METTNALVQFGHEVTHIEADFSRGREAFSVLRAQSMVNRYRDYLDKLDQMGDNISSNIRQGLNQNPIDIAKAEVARGELWKNLAERFILDVSETDDDP